MIARKKTERLVRWLMTLPALVLMLWGLAELAEKPVAADYRSGGVQPQPVTAVSFPTGGGRINVNTAGLEELTQLTGIGPAKAQAILDEREARGNYHYP